MKVFISWSGELSKQLGKCFKEWLPATLQSVRAFFSPEDINKGAAWSTELAKELEQTATGLFILTPENLRAPWMMFEAGAISKAYGESAVCPVLFELEPTAVTPPLSLYQMTKFNKADIKRLVTTINTRCGDSKLGERTMETVFDKWWPDLESCVHHVLSSRELTILPAPRSDREIIEETLGLTRRLVNNLMKEEETERFRRLLSAATNLAANPTLRSLMEQLRVQKTTPTEDSPVE